MVMQMCLGYVKGNRALAKDLSQEVFLKVWNNLDKDSKEIWKMYLDYLGYDSKDQRLVINEFIAYMLQSTDKEEYEYFIELIYYRLRRKYPDKRAFIEEYYKENSKPFSDAIKKLDIFIGKIIIN